MRDLVETDLLVEDETEITVQHLLDAPTVSVRQSVVQLQFTALAVHREATGAVLDSVRRTAECGAPVAEVALGAAVRAEGE